MNSKDQLDNNELEQNQELPGNELSDSKDKEIIGNLGELEKKIVINTIKDTEKSEEEINAIEQTREEEEKFKNDILNKKIQKKEEYIPGQYNSERDTLELANAARKFREKKVKEYIQKYPGWYGGLLKRMDNLS